MTEEKPKLTPEQKVQLTIKQIQEIVATNPDPKSFDDRIVENFDLFWKNEEFFSLPTTIIGRVLQTSSKILTPAEANRALKLHMKYLGPAGINLLMFINCGNISGGEGIEALQGLEGLPIISQLTTQPFLQPAPSKSLRVQDLEADINKLKNSIAMQNKKIQENGARAEDLKNQVEELEKFKKQNKSWPQEYKELKDKYIYDKKLNEKLTADEKKWKIAAFTKPVLEPKNFISDIFQAIEAGDAESVYYIIETDEKSVNKERDGDMLDTWTPLLLACKVGNFEIVKMLVEHGADVNRRVQHGTPLSYASKTGTGIYQYLIDNGATRE